MFPTAFKNDAKQILTTHKAITFHTELSEKSILSLLQKNGIEWFITKDLKQKSSYDPGYKNNRITGEPQYVPNAGCCSFVKDPNKWYLFPIHENELANVGLKEEDLMAWINFLNRSRAGFKYYYFGEQTISYDFEAGTGNKRSWRTAGDKPNTYYWVAYPKFGEDINRNVPYFHWICLRYLFNTTQATNSLGNNWWEKGDLAYYNIPRIAMYLHEKLGLRRLKALLYAHYASNFYSGYGLGFTDYGGLKFKSGTGVYSHDVDYSQVYTPCVNLTASQFKTIWNTPSSDGTMNYMFTKKNFDTVKKKVPELKHLDGLYMPDFWPIFRKGDYAGFVKAIDNFYKSKGSNRVTKKKKAVSV